MIKNLTSKISGTFRIAAKLLPLSLFLLSLVSVNPAYGIHLTYVRHLFDVTHNFSEPSDVSVSKDGLIYVVDGVNNKIKVFKPNGKFLFSFGSKGSGRGGFRFPLGIDIDNSGKVYVADSGNSKVQVFSKHGSFIKEFRIPSKNGTPSEPTDVAVDESRNRCYVVDNNNHYILVYDLSSLDLLKIYGRPGTERREFRFPFLITTDRDGDLYTVDVINTRVQVLNPEGLFVFNIGGWGVEKGEFFRPKGVAVDKNKRVYVSDSYMGVIQVFASTGEFYSALGDPAKGKVIKFKTPTGIFIDDKNRLYVVEMFAQKVSVYSIEDDSKYE